MPLSRVLSFIIFCLLFSSSSIGAENKLDSFDPYGLCLTVANSEHVNRYFIRAHPRTFFAETCDLLNSGKKSTAVLYFGFLLFELDYTTEDNRLTLRKGIGERTHEAIDSLADKLDRDDLVSLSTAASIFFAYHEEQLGVDLTNAILSKANAKDSAPFLKRIKSHIAPSESKLLARIDKTLRASGGGY